MQLQLFNQLNQFCSTKLNMPTKMKRRFFFDKIEIIVQFLVDPYRRKVLYRSLLAKFDVNWCVTFSILENDDELMILKKPV